MMLFPRVSFKIWEISQVSLANMYLKATRVPKATRVSCAQGLGKPYTCSLPGSADFVLKKSPSAVKTQCLSQCQVPTL
jgi:hypothetical protein